MAETNSLPPSCAQAGWVSFISYGWLTPLMERGSEQQVDVSDMPALASADDTFRNTHRILDALQKAESASKANSIMYALVAAYWKKLFAVYVLMVVHHCLSLLNPLLLQQLLVFQEKQNEQTQVSQDTVRRGMAAVSGFIFLGFFLIIYGSQLQFLRNRLTLRMSSALRGALLVRCVQGTPHQVLVGQDENTNTTSIYNVVSFDIGPVIQILWVLLGVWLFPFQFISVMILLFSQVKWAVFPGLITIIVAKIIVGVFLVFDGTYRDELLRAKDKRLAGCNEGFNNIRVLHMLAWIPPFEMQIMKARTEELHYQTLRLWMQKMVAALDYSLGAIVTLVTLSYFVFVEGGEMKASVALPVIGLISSLIGPFGQFPIWINEYMVWQSAHERVSACLGVNPDGSKSMHQKYSSSAVPPNGVIAHLENCTFSWLPTPACEKSPSMGHDLEDPEAKIALLQSERSFQLQDLCLQVRGGELLVLLGAPGHGKTSMLLGLLAEMPLEAGEAVSPAFRRLALEQGHGIALPATSDEARELLSTGPSDAANPCMVAYASQAVTLFTGTIRSNILFGMQHVPDVYEQTLRACALEDDVASMPLGDLTEVAHGGATLSGGQRARVGLARAVYRAALALWQQPGCKPLVLLDDPLSALDRRVLRQVCDGLFQPQGGLLSLCAVVLAAADAWWLGEPSKLLTRHEGGSARSWQSCCHCKAPGSTRSWFFSLSAPDGR